MERSREEVKRIGAVAKRAHLRKSKTTRTREKTPDLNFRDGLKRVIGGGSWVRVQLEVAPSRVRPYRSLGCRHIYLVAVPSLKKGGGRVPEESDQKGNFGVNIADGYLLGARGLERG